MKAAIRRTVSAWQMAARQLGAARSLIAGNLAALRRRQEPGEPDPEGVDPEQMVQDIAHLRALQQQAGNAVRDLVEAPRNEEALAEVLEPYLSLRDEMETLGELRPAGANAQVDAAGQSFADGVASLLPFVGEREELLRTLRQILGTVANEVATLAGDATEDVEPDPDPEPAPAADPAPSPNPLPSPPPPPPSK